jgi:hypothetical protein
VERAVTEDWYSTLQAGCHGERQRRHAVKQQLDYTRNEKRKADLRRQLEAVPTESCERFERHFGGGSPLLRPR